MVCYYILHTGGVLMYYNTNRSAIALQGKIYYVGILNAVFRDMNSLIRGGLNLPVCNIEAGIVYYKRELLYPMVF